MASNAAGTIITLGVVGGLGYWLFSSGMLSGLLGSSAPAAPPVSGGGNPAGGTNPVPAPATGPCSGSGVLASWLSRVQKARPYGKDFGPTATGELTIDEWCYYGNEGCTGICDQSGLTADGLFPGRDDRGGPLNWNAFSGYAQQKGLSAVHRPRRRMIGTNMVRRIAA